MKRKYKEKMTKFKEVAQSINYAVLLLLLTTAQIFAQNNRIIFYSTVRIGFYRVVFHYITSYIQLYYMIIE